MICDGCGGSGVVETVPGVPRLGTTECGICDGRGRKCRACGDPLDTTDRTELCAPCSEAECSECGVQVDPFHDVTLSGDYMCGKCHAYWRHVDSKIDEARDG